MATRGYVGLPDGQIHYQTQGSGDPVVLLHASPASSNDYRNVIPALAQTHRVVAMDTPGFGRSDPPPRRYEMPDYAACVVGVLRGLGISRAHLVGHRTGSVIALCAAARHPGVVSRLVLYGSPFYGPELRRKNLTEPKYAPVVIRDDGTNLLEVYRHEAHEMPDSSPAMVRSKIIDLMIAGPGNKEALFALFRYDMEDEMKLVKAPTLLLDWSGDPFCERQKEFKSRIPRSRIKLIEGRDGNALLEKPAQFTAAVLEFLEEPGE